MKILPIIALFVALGYNTLADGLISRGGGGEGGTNSVASQTPWTSDISAAGHQLTGLVNVIGNNTGGISGFTNLLSVTNIPASTSPGHTLQTDGNGFYSGDNLASATNYASTNLALALNVAGAVPATIFMQPGLNGNGALYRYSTNGSFTISAFVPVANQPSSAYLEITNSGGGPITATINAAYRAFSATTTNSLSIKAGGACWIYAESFTGSSTNLADSAQP